MPIPSPNKNEDRNAFLSRCIQFVKNEDPTMENDQAVTICSNKWSESKKSNQNADDWRLLQYNVPIKQSHSQSKDFIIQGTAINSTVTRNGVEFLSEELNSSASSLKNKPLLKDHNNSVDATVGRVINAFFDESTQSIQFEASVLDSAIKEKINAGLINSVSVGASVKDLELSEDENHLIARGIDFVELSLVAVPADPNAGFSHVVAEAFNLKQKIKKKVEQSQDDNFKDLVNSESQSNKLNNEEQKMSEVKEKKEDVKEEKTVQESNGEDKFTKAFETLQSTLQSVTDNNKKISERLEALETKKIEEKKETEIKESVKQEVKEDKKVEESTKGLVDDDFEEKIEQAYENIDVTKSSTGRGFDISMASYADSKRLSGQSKNNFLKVGGNN